MINKTIFKQSIIETWRLWLTFTLGIAFIICLIVGIYDESTSVSLMQAVKGTSIEDLAGDKILTITTLCGLLAETIYGIFGILLATIYSFVVANALVANEVDKGSLAYILSTPVKRITVVVTKAVFLVFSLAMMFLTIFAICSVAIQLKFGYIWGYEYSKDVKAVAKYLDLDKDSVNQNLLLIKNNPEALAAGARARGIHEDEYTEYLQLKMKKMSYKRAADVLGLSLEEVEKDTLLIKNNPLALEEAAKTIGMTGPVYSIFLTQSNKFMQGNSMNNEEMIMNLSTALIAASEELDLQLTVLLAQMSLIKDSPEAFSKAVDASGLDELVFTALLNQAIAMQELDKDSNSTFKLEAWIMINVACFLLMFATSGISFFASCFFNLTRHSLILGAGLPLSFFLLKLLSDINLSMTELRYFSLNTLYVTESLAKAEGYGLSVAVLIAVGIVLYGTSFAVFKKKDLPL